VRKGRDPRRRRPERDGTQLVPPTARRGRPSPVTRTALSTTEGPVLQEVRAAAYTIPCDASESDGTLEWDSTTIVVVDVAAGDAEGIGWTYAPVGVAKLVEQILVPALE